jgi:hypothetical protein
MNISITTPPVNGGRRVRPRKPEDYDNRDYAPRHKAREGNVARTAEDSLDSYAIIRRNKKYAIPPAEDTWHDSGAAKQLAALPKSGMWVPAWVACVAKHPARAFVLSWVLRCFEEKVQNGDKVNPQCRAQALDEQGRHWWITTRARIAEETLLDTFSADRARKALSRYGLIEVISQNQRLRVRPLTRRLGEGYIHATAGATMSGAIADELKHAEGDIDWFGSRTRIAVESDRAGTRVHDALMVLCDYEPGPALVLAHALYWHGLNDEEESRARITRCNRLWIACSQRELSRFIGGHPAALSGYVRRLAEKGYIVAEPNRWVYKFDRDRGRPTLHLRPCPERIGRALEHRKAEIHRAIERKKPAA